MLCGKITAPEHVAVPVHRVDAEYQRNRDAPRAGRQCGRVEAARELQPLARRRTIIAIRTAIAAGENRAERITREIFRHNRADVGLDDLPDLLLEAHAREQLVDARLGIRLDEAAACACGQLRMHAASAPCRGARGREKIARDRRAQLWRRKSRYLLTENSFVNARADRRERSRLPSARERSRRRRPSSRPMSRPRRY